MNRRSSKESSIQEQAYDIVDELYMTPGDSRDPSLNKTTPNEANMERLSPEDLDGGGYSSLKRRSSVTFAQSSVYAQLYTPTQVLPTIKQQSAKQQIHVIYIRQISFLRTVELIKASSLRLYSKRNKFCFNV